MFGYWLMFSLPAFAALSPMRGTLVLQRLAWAFIGILFILMIGFRHQVGGDWVPYLGHYDRAIGMPLSAAMNGSDLGYALLNWWSAHIGGGVYLINLICSFVMVVGVIAFCRRQPLPWLAFLVAVPYVLIVVAMGYTRQSVAMGFEFLALVALMDHRMRKFVFFVACGALFHKSAVMLIPLAMLASSRNKLWTFVWVGVTGLALSAAVLAEYYELLWQNYVVTKMVSDGGPVRVAMNALPALILLVFRKRLAPEDDARSLWIWMAIFSLACIPLVGVASTAVDRVALYFMPIQLYVFSRVHRLFDSRLLKTAAVVSVVLGYGLVEWVWLFYAGNAHAWLPYQFYPFT